ANEEKKYLGRDKSWLVIGDCHAAVLGVSLQKHLQSRGATLRSLAQNGCPPVPGFAHRSRYLAQFDCATQNHKVFQLIRELPPHTIVVTYRAPLYLSSLPFDNGEG